MPSLQVFPHGALEITHCVARVLHLHRQKNVKTSLRISQSLTGEVPLLFPWSALLPVRPPTLHPPAAFSNLWFSSVNRYSDRTPSSPISNPDFSDLTSPPWWTTLIPISKHHPVNFSVLLQTVILFLIFPALRLLLIQICWFQDKNHTLHSILVLFKINFICLGQASCSHYDSLSFNLSHIL